MNRSISFCDFQDAFRDYDRKENFSYDGLKALFDYLEQYEDDTGKQVELDVIALCCDYTEYGSLEEFDSEHSSFGFFDDLEDDEEPDFEKCLDKISDHTTVIRIEGTERFITQAY